MLKVTLSDDQDPQTAVISEDSILSADYDDDDDDDILLFSSRMQMGWQPPHPHPQTTFQRVVVLWLVGGSWSMVLMGGYGPPKLSGDGILVPLLMMHTNDDC